MASVVKWGLVVLYVLSSLASITMIGQPRKPITNGQAAWAVLSNAALATALIITWDTTQ